MASRFNTEVNTGLRGMFASEYHEQPVYHARPAAEAVDVAAPAPAVAPASDAPVAAAKEVAPLLIMYPRKSEHMASNHFAPVEQSGECIIDPIRVPLYTYSQLERMSGQGPRSGLKLVASDLRDVLEKTLGEGNYPKLNLFGQHDEVVKWVLNVQIMLGKASGLEVSMDNFGIPNEDDQTGRNHAQRSAV